MNILTIIVTQGALYEMIAASGCIIFNDKTACHKSCRTCASNSYCGNPNACRSCHSGEYKMAQNFNDEIFACSKTCEHFSFKLNDYFFCDISAKKNYRTSTDQNFVVENLVKIEGDENFFCENIIWIGCVGAITCVGIGTSCIIFRRRKSAARAASKSVKQEGNENEDVELGLINANKIMKKPPATPKTTFNNLKVIESLKEFEKNELIGGGHFSRVYEGKLNGQLVAIKIALKEGRKSIHKELQIYDKVKHPHILEAFGFHYGIDDMLFLALRKFNLCNYFIDYGKELNFIQLKQYCIQIADGMRYLHSKNILHCDLKINNILVKDEKGDAIEISDFGAAVELGHDHEIPLIGTVTHMSYELLKKSLNPNYSASATRASDVWSYAVTVWQIFKKTEEVPADFKIPKDIIANHENGKKLPTPDLMPELLWRHNFLRCFDLDPLARPSMENMYYSLIKFREEVPYTNVSTV